MQEDFSPFLLDNLYFKNTHLQVSDRSKQQWQVDFQKAESAQVAEQIHNKLTLQQLQSTQVKQLETYVIQGPDVQTPPSSSRSYKRRIQALREKAAQKAQAQHTDNKLEISNVTKKAIFERLGSYLQTQLPSADKQQLNKDVNKSFNRERGSSSFDTTFYMRSTHHTTNKSSRLNYTSNKFMALHSTKPVSDRYVKLAEIENMSFTKPVRRPTILSLPQHDQQAFVHFAETRQPFFMVRLDRKWCVSKFQERYGQRLTSLFIEFLEMPTIIDFNWWCKIKNKLAVLHVHGILAFCFRIFDINGDRQQYWGIQRFICSGDMFNLIVNEKLPCIEKDVALLYQFAKEGLNLYPTSGDELYDMQRSKPIRCKILRLSDVETWTQALQPDVVTINLGMKYQRVIPMFNYIGSDTYFNQPPEIPPIPSEPAQYPSSYKERQPFSMSFTQFSKAWLNKRQEIETWKDLLNMFGGRY